MGRKILTKKAKIFRSFLITSGDVDLWRAAAAREEISQSEFVRAAIRERAAKVLFKGVEPLKAWGELS